MGYLVLIISDMDTSSPPGGHYKRSLDDINTTPRRRDKPSARMNRSVLLYAYFPRMLPPIVFDPNNPASMDFVENRMLLQLSAPDAIIAAKMEQSHHVNKHRKDDPDISVGDLVAVSNESHLQHLPRGRQKLLLKWVGPYKARQIDVELHLR